MIAATDQTPIERHGNVDVKRDDLYALGGQCGGKVRTCRALALNGLASRHTAPGAGLVTAGSRHSPQVAIVATLAHALQVPARVHVPAGDDTPEIVWALEHGAEVHRHRPGHNSVIKARARTDADANGWVHIPFGMEDHEAVRQTAAQVGLQVWRHNRIVVPVGSGMSLAGILTGLEREAENHPGVAPPMVIGVTVGADPEKRLDRYAPAFWRQMVTLVPARVPYHERVEGRLGDLLLDPVYEAKCLPFLQDDDLLWVVGIRGGAEA